MTSDAHAPTGVAQIVNEITSALGNIFEAMEWAEDEIVQAQQRHPSKRDLLWKCFTLVRPTSELLHATEFVCRAHCRELLERVAAGEDTRPATDAEIAVACCETSQVAPLTATATGLYFRVWARAFPAHPVVTPEQLAHYEGLYGPRIDALEAKARRKHCQDSRTAPEAVAEGD